MAMERDGEAEGLNVDRKKDDKNLRGGELQE